MRRRLPFSPEEDQEEPPINLTPLIDVVFVLLISFMILAPILDIESVNLAESGPLSKKESPQATPLSIAIHADGSLSMRGVPVRFQDLENLLRAEKRLKNGQIPQVVPDKKAPFGTYQEVKNVLETVGFEEMEVVLKPH